MSTTTLQKLKANLALSRQDALPLAAAIGIVAGYAGYVAARQKLIGLILFAVSALVISRLSSAARRYMAALLVATLLLAFAPLITVPSWGRFIPVVGLMAGAVAVVYLVSRFWEREQLVHFNFDWHRHWRRWEVGYIVGAIAVTYFLMPYYFSTTGAIHAWYFRRDIGEIGAVFGATMTIGIWEEFFFTATVLGVLRKYLPFWLANSLQAIMFASFLYAIGFRYWAPIGLFCYGWAQGWVFNKTKSLLFVLIVHICLDLLVCFVLLHAYYPDMARVFITG